MQLYEQIYLPKLLRINEQMKHNIKDEVTFQSDLTSCLYARQMRESLQNDNILFVAKEYNQANVPQARTIE